MRFTNRRKPRSVDELQPHHLRQLDAAIALGGEMKEAAEWLEEMAGIAELWDVGDDEPRYEVWTFAADSGTIFAAGTDDVIGEIIQCTLQVDDQAVLADLRAALASSNLDGSQVLAATARLERRR